MVDTPKVPITMRVVPDSLPYGERSRGYATSQGLFEDERLIHSRASPCGESFGRSWLVIGLDVIAIIADASSQDRDEAMILGRKKRRVSNPIQSHDGLNLGFRKIGGSLVAWSRHRALKIDATVWRISFCPKMTSL